MLQNMELLIYLDFIHYYHKCLILKLYRTIFMLIWLSARCEFSPPVRYGYLTLALFTDANIEATASQFSWSTCPYCRHSTT